jgi:hypothetical protein
MDTHLGVSEDVKDSDENTSGAFDTVDEDIATNGAIDDEKSSNEVTITPGMKLDVKLDDQVKLDDLFADEDSDEEFPSSSKQDIKASSPIDAPSSPV